jgi:hypothetical protein
MKGYGLAKLVHSAILLSRSYIRFRPGEMCLMSCLTNLSPNILFIELYHNCDVVL